MSITKTVELMWEPKNIMILVRQLEEDIYQWFFADEISIGHELEVGCNTLQALKEELDEDASITFLADSQKSRLIICDYDSSEAKLLHQILPYRLEEELIRPVEELHFSLGDKNNNQVPVVITEHRQMKQWLDSFNEQGLNLQHIIPEIVLLPWAEREWILLLDDQRWLLKYGPYSGFSLEAEVAALTLKLLLNEQQPPEVVKLYCKEEDKDSLIKQLPADLQRKVIWQSGEYWPLLAANFGEHEPLDMLQGDFARTLPWRKWWSQWRAAALLLLAIFVIKGSAVGIELYQLQHQDLVLRQAIEKSYRSVIPEGPLVDAEQQLKSRLAPLQNNTDKRFMIMLDEIAKQIMKAQGLILQSINYSDTSNELRMTIVANNFDDIDKILKAIKTAGLQAELRGSNAEGNKIRARIKVGPSK